MVKRFAGILLIIAHDRDPIVFLMIELLSFN